MASSAMSWGIRTVDAYQKLEQVGEGTYGHVFKGVERKTGEQVALKRLIFHAPKEPAGMPQYAIREIKALKQLAHKNIVKLKDVVVSFDEEDNTKEEDNELRRCGQLYLVFEYVDHDLAGLLDNRYEFTPQAIKSIMKQLFEVLDFLHSKQYIHRDVKCSNLLLSNHYVLKLADFGLSRSLQVGYDESFLRPGQRRAPPKMTFNVITLWYRPPELLLGSRDYDYAVDLWSAGCILGEMLARRPLFPAKTEAQQLDTIFQRVGTPTKTSWPEYDTLPNPYNYTFLPVYPQDFASLFPYPIPQSALDLVQRLLAPDPTTRYSCQKALEHRYFVEEPRAPASPEELGMLNLTPGASLHEYQTKKAKRAAKAAQEGQDVEATLALARIGAPLPQVPDSAPPSWFPPPPSVGKVPAIPPVLPVNAPITTIGYPPYQAPQIPGYQAAYHASQYNAPAYYQQSGQYASAEAERVRQHMMYNDTARAALSVNYQQVTVAPPIVVDYSFGSESTPDQHGPPSFTDQQPQPAQYSNGRTHRSRSRSFGGTQLAENERFGRRAPARHESPQRRRDTTADDWHQQSSERGRGSRNYDRSRDTRDLRRPPADWYQNDRDRHGPTHREAQAVPRFDRRESADKGFSNHTSRSDSRGRTLNDNRERYARRSRSRSRSRNRASHGPSRHSGNHSHSHSHSRSQSQSYYQDSRRSNPPPRSDSRDRDHRRFPPARR